MQMDEAPAVAPKQSLAPLEMPAPELLGLSVKSRSSEVNWDEVRSRLQRLHAVSFHSQRIPGGFRFTCALPGGVGRQLQAAAANEADAIDEALTRAESMR